MSDKLEATASGRVRVSDSGRLFIGCCCPGPICACCHSGPPASCEDVPTSECTGYIMWTSGTQEDCFQCEDVDCEVHARPCPPCLTPVPMPAAIAVMGTGIDLPMTSQPAPSGIPWIGNEACWTLFVTGLVEAMEGLLGGTHVLTLSPYCVMNDPFPIDVSCCYSWSGFSLVDIPACPPCYEWSGKCMGTDVPSKVVVGIGVVFTYCGPLVSVTASVGPQGLGSSAPSDITMSWQGGPGAEPCSNTDPIDCGGLTGLDMDGKGTLEVLM